jgi:energy-coupling factor transporter ATP-binding protein EcfA2
MNGSGTQSGRGSVWHRWDPHLHAPGTLLSDQFKGDWDAYLSKIEKSEPRIVALGVTDYFCIETYKEVRKRKAAGRLPDVEFLFPNVELRIETKTQDQRAINIHLLFSPDDPNHEAEIERILGQLDFDFKDKQYNCSRSDLIALGRAHDPTQTDERGALKTGANQFKTTLRDLKARFKKERWMREHCLVAVAGKSSDGSAGLQEDDAFAAMRLELERFADIIFSSRSKDRAFWLGESPKFDRDQIEQRYRGLKPCLHGSDAHTEETTGEPPQERYCWLKGDLTFETLRQAVVEPGERVSIGSQPPSYAIPAAVVSRVRTTASPWMKNNSIDLNSGLVAIIGSRGSGKTALADIIAIGAHAESAGQGEASFLNRASRPVDHLRDGGVELTWGDDTTTVANLRPGGFEGKPEAVRYLSQHFVERLCSASGLATELREAMERVVFESTNPLDRLEAETFAELAERLLQPVRMRYRDLQEQINTIGDAVVQEDILLERLPALRLERATLAKKIESAKSELAKLVPQGNVEHAAALARLETLCAGAQAKVETLRRRQRTVEDLATALAHQEKTVEPTRFAALKQQYAAAQLTENEWRALRMKFQGDTAAAIQAARLRAANAVKAALDEEPSAPVDRNSAPNAQWPLNVLIAERTKARELVGIDIQRQKKYSEGQQQIAKDQVSLSRLDTQLEHASGSDARRKEHIALRRRHYVEIFEQLVQEEAVLKDLYAPLQNRLKHATGALTKLAFVVQRRVDVDSWCKKGEQLFDLRARTRFKGHGAIRTQAEELLSPAWSTGSSEAVAAAMDNFREVLQKELKTMPPWVSAEERRAWNKDVAGWLYDTSHITVHYGIEYEGVAIEQLSPGTRGVVLLLLYLAVDRQDQRPLIIDQPEENLDPNSVFEELVPHFREARRRRQVIVVTHNANLVVNTDADQVLVASSVRKAANTLPDISYQSGSLENPMIRGLVCQILEGGERAFLERERRYRLRWGQNLLEEP